MELKYSDRVALNPLEGIGSDAVRVERVRTEWDELTRAGKKMAMKLRVMADCLDEEHPATVTGLMEDGMLLVENCEEKNKAAHEHLNDYPSAKNIFRIPDGVSELIERMHKTRKLLFTYEEMLTSSLRFYLHNNASDSE